MLDPLLGEAVKGVAKGAGAAVGAQMVNQAYKKSVDKKIWYGCFRGWWCARPPKKKAEDNQVKIDDELKQFYFPRRWAAKCFGTFFLPENSAQKINSLKKDSKKYEKDYNHAHAQMEPRKG